MLYPMGSALAYDHNVTVHVTVGGHHAPDGTEVEIRYTVEGRAGIVHWESVSGVIQSGKAVLKVPDSNPRGHYRVCAFAILPDSRKIKEACSNALTSNIWLFG